MTVPRPTGATMARHRSKQDVETPPDFMRSVVRRFGPISFDLATDGVNIKAARGFDEDCDGLAQDWSSIRGNLWLNPPYGNIEPWAARCSASVDAAHKFDRILMLVPASVGSRWFARHVHGRAMVLALVGRLKFVGHTSPFPKDLILAEYGRFTGFDCWDWRPDSLQT